MESSVRSHRKPSSHLPSFDYSNDSLDPSVHKPVEASLVSSAEVGNDVVCLSFQVGEPPRGVAFGGVVGGGVRGVVRGGLGGFWDSW